MSRVLNLSPEKVDARRERPLGDLGGPTSRADARRREVRTQVRGRAGIDGEMIHARGSGPRGGALGTPWGASKVPKEPG